MSLNEYQERPYLAPSITVLKLEGDEYDPVVNFVVVIGKFNPKKKYFRLVQRKDGRWCVSLRSQCDFMDSVKMAVGALHTLVDLEDREKYAPLNHQQVTQREREDAERVLELAKQYLPRAGVRI